VAERLDAATGAGAYAVTAAGDWEGLPTWNDLAVMRAEGDQVQR
jgi:2-dehydro-3-deoxygluconokinase